ncbi:MAG: hypothetical protein PHP08_03145 [Candidatus Dojkabacteria bacterium]|nr:hypothetical protein [Candidatus Dojkabacteria bacterium]
MAETELTEIETRDGQNRKIEIGSQLDTVLKLGGSVKEIIPKDIDVSSLPKKGDNFVAEDGTEYDENGNVVIAGPED